MRGVSGVGTGNYWQMLPGWRLDGGLMVEGEVFAGWVRVDVWRIESEGVDFCRAIFDISRKLN